MIGVSNRICSFNSLAASKPLQKDARCSHSCLTFSFNCQNTWNARSEPRCSAAVLEGQKAAGTKPLPRLNWRLDARRDLVTVLLPSRAWQTAETASNRPTAGCSHNFCGSLPMWQKSSFLLAKIIQMEVLQHLNFFPKEELDSCTQPTLTPNQQPRYLQQQTSAAINYTDYGFGVSVDATLNKELASR